MRVDTIQAGDFLRLSAQRFPGRDCFVFDDGSSQPDEHWGEIVVAFVTAASGATIEQEELRRFCRERLASYKVPAVVTVIDQMPLNASGKILKRELRTRLGPG